MTEEEKKRLEEEAAAMQAAANGKQSSYPTYYDDETVAIVDNSDVPEDNTEPQTATTPKSPVSVKPSVVVPKGTIETVEENKTMSAPADPNVNFSTGTVPQTPQSIVQQNEEPKTTTAKVVAPNNGAQVVGSSEVPVDNTDAIVGPTKEEVNVKDDARYNFDISKLGKEEQLALQRLRDLRPASSEEGGGVQTYEYTAPDGNNYVIHVRPGETKQDAVARFKRTGEYIYAGNSKDLLDLLNNVPGAKDYTLGGDVPEVPYYDTRPGVVDVNKIAYLNGGKIPTPQEAIELRKRYEEAAAQRAKDAADLAAMKADGRYDIIAREYGDQAALSAYRGNGYRDLLANIKAPETAEEREAREKKERNKRNLVGALQMVGALGNFANASFSGKDGRAVTADGSILEGYDKAREKEKTERENNLNLYTKLKDKESAYINEGYKNLVARDQREFKKELDSANLAIKQMMAYNKTSYNDAKLKTAMVNLERAQLAFQNAKNKEERDAAMFKIKYAKAAVDLQTSNNNAYSYISTSDGYIKIPKGQWAGSDENVAIAFSKINPELVKKTAERLVVEIEQDNENAADIVGNNELLAQFMKMDRAARKKYVTENKQMMRVIIGMVIDDPGAAEAKKYIMGLSGSAPASSNQGTGGDGTSTAVGTGGASVTTNADGTRHLNGSGTASGNGNGSKKTALKKNKK